MKVWLDELARYFDALESRPDNTNGLFKKYNSVVIFTYVPPYPSRSCLPPEPPHVLSETQRDVCPLLPSPRRW